jgi:hypothetical protein
MKLFYKVVVIGGAAIIAVLNGANYEGAGWLKSETDEAVSSVLGMIVMASMILRR